MHSSVPGSELTREPFRWDQRLYALVLRMAGKLMPLKGFIFEHLALDPHFNKYHETPELMEHLFLHVANECNGICRGLEST